MGELLPFPNRLGARRIGTASPETAKVEFNATTKRLETALGLLDQMAAQIEQMNRLLPGYLVSHFKKRQLAVLTQIKQAHAKVASPSETPKD